MHGGMNRQSGYEEVVAAIAGDRGPFSLNEGFRTAVSPMQPQRRRWLRRVVTRIRSRGRKPHSFADEVARLYAWTYAPTGLGHVDGPDRHQRG